MKLTVREAATHLGRTERAVRAALSDGRIRGHKHGGRWVIHRRDLPLTEVERARVEATIEDLHEAVDEAVPPHIRRSLGSHGVAGLRAWQAARAALAAVGDTPGARPIHDALREGARALAEGHHQYDRQVKLAALTRARAWFSRAIADLLLAEGELPDADRLGARLEADCLGPLGGMMRRAESLPVTA